MGFRVDISATAPGGIVVSPKIFDLLRNAGMLRVVGRHESNGTAGRGWDVWGYDVGDDGNAIVWLVWDEVARPAVPSDFSDVVTTAG